MKNNKSDKDSKDLDVWYETKFKPAVLSLANAAKRIDELEKISPEKKGIVELLRLESLVRMAEMSTKMANKEAAFLEAKEKNDVEKRGANEKGAR